MTFIAIVVPREDGDADCFAAFNVENMEGAEKSAEALAKEFMAWHDVPSDAEIILIENITDVIDEDYWNECVLGKDKTIASWNYTLDVCCPKCFEDVDVAGCNDVKDFILQEAHDIKVNCPLCGKEFTVDLVL
jgi:hypothetical protein